MRLFLFVNIALLVCSCQGKQEHSQLDYYPTKFNCESLNNPTIKESCLETEAFKQLNVKNLDEYLRLFGEEFIQYNDSYYSAISSDFSGFRSLQESIRHSKDMQVILSGDVHTDDDAMDMHLKLITMLNDFRPGEVICGTEMPKIGQYSIDSYREGNITELQMKRVVEDTAALEWINWKRYFDFCMQNNLGFYALDIEQNGESMLERDQMIAANIEEIHKRFPNKVLFAPYGTLHLAGYNKLPELLAEKGIVSFQFLTIAPDGLHWQCAEAIGSESKMNEFSCSIDKKNAYVFPSHSLQERIKVLWDF